MQSTGTSSDIEEEIYPTDKYNYVRLVPDHDKISNCTKLQVLQETKYPEYYYRVVRFLDNIEAESEKVPGSIYHNRTLFRVSFYQEKKCEFTEKEDKYPYPSTIYTSVIFPIVRLNIPYGIWRLSYRHTRPRSTGNLNTSNICRNICDPRYFLHNPRPTDWYERQNRKPDYVIDTYDEVQPREPLTVVRRVNWQERITTIYRQQQITTETNR
jgi:hypothetical protein